MPILQLQGCEKAAKKSLQSRFPEHGFKAKSSPTKRVTHAHKRKFSLKSEVYRNQRENELGKSRKKR